MKLFGYSVITISLLFVSGISILLLWERGTVYAPANTGWSVEVNGKKFINQKVPIHIDALTPIKEGDVAIVQKNVDVPSLCSSKPCYLFLGEIGDLTEVWLNGRLIRTQGYADHTKIVAKHFPFWLQVPPGFSGKLNVKIQIETLYGVGFGLQRGPAFIGDYMAVRSYERKLFIESVVFPLMQSLLLGILGLLVLTTIMMVELPEPFFRFAVFCISASAFILSFSFIPREYLPAHYVGFTHYTLRALADWTLFEVINSILPMAVFVRRIFRTLLALSLMALAVLLFRNAPFGQYITTVKVISVVIVAIPLSGLLTALYYWKLNRSSLAPQEMDLGILIPTLVVLTLGQCWDTFNFWTWVSGPYVMKFYLAPLAFMFALVLVKRLIRDQKNMSRAKAEAERDALVGQIAIEFSHDLQSPLNALKDCAVLALEKDDDKFIRKVLGDVARRTNEVTGRLQELLEYSREEIKDKKIVPLRDLVTAVQEDLTPLLRSRGIKLDVIGKETEFNVDAISFRRALTNLVQNAVDASKDNGIVKISGEKTGSRQLISVQDFGSGIVETDLPKIFDPYFSKGKENGTGLGLSIVDRIIRQHGGTVQVSSHLSKGTTFVMEVPT